MRVSICDVYLLDLFIFWILGTDKTSKTWYLSTWSSTWYKAVEECKSYGMKLTTFGSDKKEEDELLKLYRASSTHPDAFVGYTDEGHEGTFTTVEGEKLQISLDFHTNEPNNLKGIEDCLEFKLFNNVIKYNDNSCNSNRWFICEFENNVQISCDLVNEDNIRLQNESNEANLNLKRTDKFFEDEKSKFEVEKSKFEVEKSKFEEMVKKQQNGMFEVELRNNL